MGGNRGDSTPATVFSDCRWAVQKLLGIEHRSNDLLYLVWLLILDV